ncbi:MAG TPA: hypothetical protein VGE98_02885, partial [Thermoanaerobaculia bacterium]
SLLAPYLSVAANASEARGAMALGVGLTISVVLALAFGATILGRDLSERRLGFYFSRPLASWAIWSGKLAAAATLAFSAGVVALLPALLLGDVWRFLPPYGGGLAFLSAGAAVVVLVLVAHAASTVLRARSAWLAVDVAALAAFLSVAYFAGRKLALAGAIDSIARIQPLLAFGAAVALVAAIALQVSGGRTDLHRGYRLLSLSLWGLLLLMALGYAAFARWTVDVSLADLSTVRGVIASPDGRFAALHGPARYRGSYEPTLLVDVASRRSRLLRTGQWPYFPAWVAFSADSRRAVWMEPAGTALDSRLDLLQLDLTKPAAKPVATTLSFVRGSDFLVALSPDGRLISTLGGGRWRVEEIDGGRLLAAAEAPPLLPGGMHQLHFFSPHRIRLEENVFVEKTEDAPTHYRFQTYDLDLDAPHARPVGTFSSDVAYVLTSPGGDRLLSLSEPSADDPGRFQLMEFATRRPIAEIPQLGRRTMMGFLRDGRLLQVTTGAETRVQLSVFDRDGKPQGEPIRLDGRTAFIGGQPDSDHLVLTLSPAGGPGGRLLLVDLRDGRVRQIATDLVPVACSLWNN